MAQKVKKGDMVTVVGTGVSKHLPSNKKVRVHKVAAEKLIESGKAKAESKK